MAKKTEEDATGVGDQEQRDPAATAQEELEAVKNDLRSLKEDVRALLSAYKGEGAERLREAGAHIREEVRQRAEQARDAGRRCADRTEQAIHEHPLTAVVGALGVGMILGRILAGRHG